MVEHAPEPALKRSKQPEAMFVADAQYDAMSTLQLRSLVRGGPKPERARAMAALARRAAVDVEVRRDVLDMISDADYRSTRFMGTISLAHIGVACLLLTGTPDLTTEVTRIVEAWPEPDRTDLLWFLRSQGVQVD